MPDLGQKVLVKAYLIRSISYGMDEPYHHVRLKSWERQELSDAIHGIYVGRRMKSNGSTKVDHDSVPYKPVAYFETWLVAFNENREIMVCLPNDVEELK